MMKCLILFETWPELRAHLSTSIQGVELLFTEGKEDRVLTMAQDADLCIGWQPSQEFLLAAKALKLFINPGAGMKKLLERIHESGRLGEFTVVNGHGNAFYTAEHAVAMLLSLTNGLVPHHQAMLDGQWRLGDEHFKSRTLRRKTVGLVGYGHINKTVEQMLSAFEISIKHYTSNTTEELESFAANCEVLIIAAPHTSDTEGMVNAQVLEALGKEGIIVNVGRGPLVDEEAMFNWLKQNPSAQAGIDVWYEYEPEEVDGKKRPYEHPFHELDNVLLSPHRGASPFDDLERWNDVIENVNRFAQGRTDLLNVVDVNAGY